MHLKLTNKPIYRTEQKRTEERVDFEDVADACGEGDTCVDQFMSHETT